MMYQGGKAKIAGPIAEILISAAEQTGRTTYVEPFVGSAAVLSRVASSYSRAVGADLMPDLVALWQAVLGGWIPPESLSAEEYADLRDAAPSPLRGFAGFPCSFGGKWFGGYACDPKSDRNFARTASRSIVRRAASMPEAEIRLADYRDLGELIGPDAVVYADPPYAGTLAYKGAGAFDSAAFWARMSAWTARGALVLVSEYAAPASWVEVWSVDRHVSTARDNSGRRATDRLFALPSTAAALGLQPVSSAEALRAAGWGWLSPVEVAAQRVEWERAASETPEGFVLVELPRVGSRWTRNSFGRKADQESFDVIITSHGPARGMFTEVHSVRGKRFLAPELENCVYKHPDDFSTFVPCRRCYSCGGLTALFQPTSLDCDEHYRPSPPSHKEALTMTHTTFQPKRRDTIDEVYEAIVEFNEKHFDAGYTAWSVFDADGDYVSIETPDGVEYADSVAEIEAISTRIGA